jgi:O-antigen/teichoic acid export membrane protein
LDTPEAGGRTIRGSALRAASFAASTLLALVSVPLLLRHLGVVEFGRYFTITSLIGLVAGVTDVGLGGVVLREYSVRTGAARDAFMRSVLGARLLLSAVGVGAACLFAVAADYSDGLVLGTLLAGIGLLLTVMAHTYSIPLAAGLRVGRLAGTELIGATTTVALVVILVLSSADTAAFLAVPIPVGLVVVSVTVLLVRGGVPLRPSWKLVELRELLGETLPVAAATVMHTLYARVAIVLMSLIATALATGMFGTALRVVEVAAGLSVVLVATTFPVLARAARDDHARLRYALQRVFEVALIGGVWMSLVVALGAGTILAVLGGEEAMAATGVLQVLGAILAVGFLTTVWQHALFALRRHRALLVVNSAALITTVAATLILVPVFEAQGAAIAVLASESLLMVLSAVALLRAHPHLRPQLAVVPRVTLAAAAALMVGLMPGMAEPLGVVASTVVYFGLIVALGAMPRELRGALARPVAR